MIGQRDTLLPVLEGWKDNHIKAANYYIKHWEAEHGVVLGDLERGDLPIIMDSPQTRPTHLVWVVNNILLGLVEKMMPPHFGGFWVWRRRRWQLGRMIC